jgi:alkylation response protein AidB-like acyl-CoA dehydrogenase
MDMIVLIVNTISVRTCLGSFGMRLMDFSFTAQELAFRDEVRSFIAANLTDDVARRFKRGWRWTRPETEMWTRKLHAVGWSAPNWPVAYGGTGWTPIQKHIFEMETWGAGAPPTHNQNFDLVGPIVYSFGSEEQKARVLPLILAGDYYWAQGFSEPGAGSDLASLKTKAVRDGDHYVVNGQKTWTTDANVCNGVFTLVRTDPTSSKPQAGISFLLIDLDLPGVTVRPIEMLNGEKHLNEVFFDNVRVPVENLVGEENKGWGYSKILLTHERVASARVFELRRDLAEARRHAAEMRVRGERLIDERGFSARLARLDIEVAALEFTVLRVLTEGEHANGRAASVLKIQGSELLQKVSALKAETLGCYAEIAYPVPDGWEEPWLNTLPGPDWASGAMGAYLQFRAATIYGGSNEIQRTIIARSVLGR